jgi:hypothetical protein
MYSDRETSWLPRPLLLLKWAFLGAAVSSLWLAFNYDRLKDYFEARVRRSDINRRVESMERQYSQLQQEKSELEKWGFSAEKVIRERFKMSRPGERVIIIEPPSSESGSSPSVDRFESEVPEARF